MDKFRTVIDGKLISDSATAVGGYDYVGYVSGRSNTGYHTWVIRRNNTAGTEYKYAVGSSVKETYEVAWARKDKLKYSRMDLINTGQ